MRVTYAISGVCTRRSGPVGYMGICINRLLDNHTSDGCFKISISLPLDLAAKTSRIGYISILSYFITQEQSNSLWLVIPRYHCFRFSLHLERRSH